MKLLGKITLTLLTLLIITSIILWALAKNINPETIKKLVSNQISALTHKQSRVDGVISWQLFPRPGLKFSKVIIGDEQLQEEYSLTIDTMLLNLKITPLFSGNFVFSDVNIDGLKAVANLNAEHPPKTKEAPQAQDSNKAHYKQQFAIEHLSINHGQITIKNHEQATIFKNVQIGIDQFNLQNTPFTVQIKAKLSQYCSNALIGATINFKGRFSLLPDMLTTLHHGINQSTIDGQLLLQNVAVNQFIIKKISATIKTNKEGFQFNPLTLSLYNGESIGNMDYSNTLHQFSLNQTATHLNGKQLMTDLLGYEMISGDLDYSIHAIVPAEKISLESITGKGTITIKNGEIYHISLEQLLTALKDRLSKLSIDKPQEFAKALQHITLGESDNLSQGNTAFKLAGAQYQFHNGILSSDSVLLQTDKLQVKGQGTINLTNYELNSKLQASVNNNTTEPAFQKIQQLLGGYFPLIVTGTLYEPRVSPDFKHVTALYNNLLINTPLEKPVNDLKNRLKEFIP